MKNKEKTSLSNMTVEELHKKVVDTRQKLIKVQNEKPKTQVKNTRLYRVLRKEIAILLSIIRQKELLK